MSNPPEDPKQRLKWRTCDSKVRFMTLREAADACWSMMEKKNARLRPYKCPYCGSWHIGHRHGEWRQERIENLLGYYQASELKPSKASQEAAVKTAQLLMDDRPDVRLSGSVVNHKRARLWCWLKGESHKLCVTFESSGRKAVVTMFGGEKPIRVPGTYQSDVLPHHSILKWLSEGGEVEPPSTELNVRSIIDMVRSSELGCSPAAMESGVALAVPLVTAGNHVHVSHDATGGLSLLFFSEWKGGQPAGIRCFISAEGDCLIVNPDVEPKQVFTDVTLCVTEIERQLMVLPTLQDDLPEVPAPETHEPQTSVNEPSPSDAEVTSDSCEPSSIG